MSAPGGCEISSARPIRVKIIPHVDGTPRFCELVRYCLEDITLKEAWTGPAALGLFPHALADVARLPVREVVSALHFKADFDAGAGRGRVRLHGQVSPPRSLHGQR